ncbi:MAG: hypothetical protein ACT4PY_08575 [Armatimonadota bacterium]
MEGKEKTLGQSRAAISPKNVLRFFMSRRPVKTRNVTLSFQRAGPQEMYVTLTTKVPKPVEAGTAATASGFGMR